MTSSHDKAAERASRYRIRQKARADALFAHATEIELAWFGTNRKGEHIAIGMDGKRVDLIVPESSPVVAPLPVEPGPEDPRPTKRVYVPKSWDAAMWNSNRDSLIATGVTREVALARMEELAAAKTGDPDVQKKVKHARAVFEAMPDVPDWATHLPVAPVE